MEKDAFESIVDALGQLDSDQEFTPFLKDLKPLQVKTSEEIQKTLAFLSEFGQLQSVTTKLKNIRKKAQNGQLTYEDLRKSIQETAGVSSQELLEMYQISHSLFSEGKFDQAVRVSTFLSYVNPEVSAFWRMTGACYWHLDDKKSALGPFLFASMVNSLEVDNHLAVLDCLHQLGFTQETLNYYNTAKEVLSDVNQWDDIKKLDEKIAKI